MTKAKRILFILCGALSLLYYIGCAAFGGFGLSLVWIWLLLGGFCFVRVWMLTRKIKGKTKVKVPKWMIYVYRVVWIVGITLFVFVESQILIGMNSKPKEDLPYVIVLGAGVRGTTPSRPLLLRIQKAHEYMTENPDTILIASGGQGPGEDISEATCIKNYLVEMGIEEERILLEDRSTSTEENMRFSYELIPNKEAEVGILTNGFHIYRSLLLAKDEGIENVTGIPTRTLMPLGVHYMVREFFACVYRVIF